jgi:hypothetical protein
MRYANELVDHRDREDAPWVRVAMDGGVVLHVRCNHDLPDQPLVGNAGRRDGVDLGLVAGRRQVVGFS